MRLYKCYGNKCVDNNIKHKIEDLIPDGGKRYCKECLEQKKKDIEDRDILYNTIRRLYKIEFPTGMMLRQIKNYKDNNYTYENMNKTLLYLEKDGVKFNYKYGLGLISFKYNEAVEFYREQEERMKNQLNNNISGDNTITVISNRPNNLNSIKNERLIDLENLI